MRKVLLSTALAVCALAFSAKAQSNDSTATAAPTGSGQTTDSTGAAVAAPTDTTGGAAPASSMPAGGGSNDSGTRLRIYSGKHDGNNVVNKPK